MKSKTLQKKIRRLEKRLQQGPKKLAKWKRKLEALFTSEATKARKKAAAKAVATRQAKQGARASSRQQSSAAAKEAIRRNCASCCPEAKEEAQAFAGASSAIVRLDESPLGGEKSCGCRGRSIRRLGWSRFSSYRHRSVIRKTHSKVVRRFGRGGQNLPPQEALVPGESVMHYFA